MARQKDHPIEVSKRAKSAAEDRLGKALLGSKLAQAKTWTPTKAELARIAKEPITMIKEALQRSELEVKQLIAEKEEATKQKIQQIVSLKKQADKKARSGKIDIAHDGAQAKKEAQSLEDLHDLGPLGS